MYGSLRPLGILIGLGISSLMFGQVSFGGRPLGTLPHGPWLPTAHTVSLPVVDADELLSEDAEREARGEKGPFRFGFNHTVDLGMDNSGVWHTLRNGDRVWRIAIECPAAFSMNFRFDEYVVPEGAKVFVYNDDGTTFGAFTAKSNPGQTRLGVSQMPGSRITVEYHEPASCTTRGRLHIDRVTHAYRDVFKVARDLGDSGPCNVNVICPEGDDWRDQIRSVAIITTNGSGFCTGTLLNNCALDSTPYFLTANHCLGSDVADWIFRFNWDSPVCEPTENGPIDQTVSGSTLLVNSAGTDMAFLELSSIPPDSYNVFYSGWYSGPNAADSLAGIHHPRGDIKKISHSYGPILTANIDVGNGPADCWHVTTWHVGTTEPGSSGSGIWNQDKLLVGQLYGGAANCANSVDDYYGRLDVSWPLLEQWLGACGDSLVGLGDEIFVEEPIHFDAAVTSIVGIPPLLCGVSEIQPIVTLKNNGDVVLTSITVTYGVIGGTQYVFLWTGSLSPLQTVNVTLPPIPIDPGNQVLAVTSSAPNGNVDEVILNDSWQTTFISNDPGAQLSLQLTLDNYGSDVTWTLDDEDGTQLYAGGPYTDFHNGMLVSVPFCLTNGCYTFTINDEFGNGLCCDDGNGGYEILDADSTVQAQSNGQYTFQHVSVVCVEVVGINDLDWNGGITLQPNPTDGLFRLRLSGIDRVERLNVLDAMGRTVVQGGALAANSNLVFDLRSLAPGTYLVVAEHARGRSVQRLVITR